MKSTDTLVIIKPHLVKDNKEAISQIIDEFKKNGLIPKSIKEIKINLDQAKEFYSEHKERDFFESIINSLSASKSVVIHLYHREEAILRTREIIGSTDPVQAKVGTIRKIYGIDIEKNAIHASDSLNSAEKELKIFFSKKSRERK